MQQRMLLILLNCCVLFIGAPAAAQKPIVCSTMASTEQVQRALAERSVAIVRIAQAGDATRLATLVAPGAEFTLINRDVIMPSAEGPAGAVKFAQELQPRGFDFAVAESGPTLAQICGKQDVTVRFANGSDTAYLVKFGFDRGLLVRATGTLVTVSTAGMGANGG
jgi:hypothetical protein